MWQNLRWEINAKFKEKIHRHVSSFQVIILGFMLVILLGSLCLTLPLATRDRARPFWTLSLHPPRRYV